MSKWTGTIYENDVWSEGLETDCQMCGERAVCQHLNDPYLDEICDVQSRQWLCGPCFSQRKDDI